MTAKIFSVKKNVIEGLDEKIMSILKLNDGDEVEAVADRNTVLLRKGGKVYKYCYGKNLDENPCYRVFIY